MPAEPDPTTELRERDRLENRLGASRRSSAVLWVLITALLVLTILTFGKRGSLHLDDLTTHSLRVTNRNGLTLAELAEERLHGDLPQGKGVLKVFDLGKNRESAAESTKLRNLGVGPSFLIISDPKRRMSLWASVFKEPRVELMRTTELARAELRVGEKGGSLDLWEGSSSLRSHYVAFNLARSNVRTASSTACASRTTRGDGG